MLGGTAFLSRAVAAEAVARGHDVTCAARGRSGTTAAGSRLVLWDRTEEPPEELVAAGSSDSRFDAVVDVARIPSHVRRAVAALPDAHWVFVSTCNVYADHATRGATAETLPLLEPISTDEDPTASPDAYGGMKVACEQLVQEGAASSAVVRAGLIVGPGDPSGRFASWVSRVASGGEVLVPEPREDPVQWVDVRDLAVWLVDLAERRTTGVFDGIGAPVTRSELVQGLLAGAGSPATRPVWVPRHFLVEHGVAEWTGPRSITMWISDPDWQGFLAHDTAPSYAAGLRTRPLAATARDTLAWLRATRDATVTGLTRAEENEILAAWRARRPTLDP